MNAIQIAADEPTPEATATWALSVAQAAEVVKEADEAAAAARFHLNDLLAQRP